ncbi:hypothetical protein GCM10011584_34280 [Nocardioides phosphati]|uniref:Plasmid mobilization relaxosome protein MobC n=1 Tax=Nocardioides phosphati TaxID=1867775 RepID=A0ABQ2NJK2_9ACTN|nr:plasmid mobilization relaxosome protein MobC [Nocardioides phosphati]GGO94076.1 hypothetical protein GCM10011584_34280 [Nocardioides phosphati]
MSEEHSRNLRRRRRENVPGGRSHPYKVLVSEDEKQQLEALAGAAKVSVQRLLVASALAGDRGGVDQQRENAAALFHIERLLANLANNINQIARQANADNSIREDTRVVLAEVRKAAKRIDATLDQMAW